MRIRFILIFILALGLILASSIVITYRAIKDTQTAVETSYAELIEKAIQTHPEIYAKYSLHKALSRPQAVDITRKAMYSYLIQAGFMFALLLLFLFGVTRPARRLARSLENFSPRLTGYQPIKEQGAYEVRSLARTFNRLLFRLKDYEDLIGDTQRYRGWKEISRVIVHEVNNVLSPVTTSAGVLWEKWSEKEIPWEKMGERLQFILRQLEEARAVLHKFRDLSHLPEPQLQPVDIMPLLQAVCAEFPGAELSPANEPLILSVDPVLFKELVRNIVKNGLESGEGVKVQIAIKKRGEGLEINVSDNGPGIPADVAEKIFEPGFSTHRGHIGIGLSIVRSIVREHQARIEVDSVPEQGSVFRLIWDRT